MIPYEKLNGMPFGGDYNPEQWPEDIWEEDMNLFRKAHISIVTLNVFSWASLQPAEDQYDFSRLDRIVSLVQSNQLQICMATSTGAHPAWMARRYPDILRTDFEGRKRKFGGRHNSCPNSPHYRKYAPLLARKLAEHYADCGSIIAWHISNEFSGECYCENCEKAFRVWLRKRYGSLEKLNHAWNTAFWSHTFYDWDEITAPDLRTEHFSEEGTTLQGCSLDYRRFMSDSMLECYELEQAAIKDVIPGASCTTNMMGFYKPLNYKEWARKMDFVSWDNYPSNEQDYASIAMAHDLMRGIHQQDPFFLMEQSPSVSNWLPYNALKRPGVLRLWSYQAVAHGADSVMFFQLRRSRGGCEKMHGALIDHVGTDETRVFREMSALGDEIGRIGGRIMGSRTPSRAAMVVDWENWWAVEYSAGPSRELRYRTELERFYCPARKAGINLDLISLDDDLSSYDIVITPLLYMIRKGQDEKLRSFVRNGGTLITGFFSGIADESDLVELGGYPGKLKDILGIWVEEQDALPEGTLNAFSWQGKQYPARLLCDLIHLRGARQMDDHGYEKDFYSGMPVVTRNDFGAGQAWYIATASSPAFYEKFLTQIYEEKTGDLLPVCSDMIKTSLQDKDDTGDYATVPSDMTLTAVRNGNDTKACATVSNDMIETAVRENDRERIWFFLNHGNETGKICPSFEGEDLLTGEIRKPGEITIKAKDVLILAEKRPR